MKLQKTLLIAVALTCFALLGGAVYFQYTAYMYPCPWCVIQRYEFTAIALLCLAAAFMSGAKAKICAVLGTLVALGGIGAASWLVYIQAHPSVSCGLDPVESALNKFPTAKLLPFLYKADGMCTTEYDPILGLSMPQWSLTAFVCIAIVLIVVAVRRAR